MIIRDMVCMWCGAYVPKSKDAEMREHIRTCEKSEHVQRIAELEAALERLATEPATPWIRDIAREALKK